MTCSRSRTSGRCYFEKTAKRTCPEGFDNEPGFNFYELSGKLVGTAVAPAHSASPTGPINLSGKAGCK